MHTPTFMRDRQRISPSQPTGHYVVDHEFRHFPLDIRDPAWYFSSLASIVRAEGEPPSCRPGKAPERSEGALSHGPCRRRPRVGHHRRLRPRRPAGGSRRPGASLRLIRGRPQPGPLSATGAPIRAVALTCRCYGSDTGEHGVSTTREHDDRVGWDRHALFTFWTIVHFLDTGTSGWGWAALERHGILSLPPPCYPWVTWGTGCPGP